MPITDRDISRFTEGDCHIFAAALEKLTGWPLHCFTYQGAPSDHAFVVRPDGKAVDIEGVHEMREFKKAWHCHKYARFTRRQLIEAEWGGPVFGDYSYRRARQLAPVIARKAGWNAH